MNEIIRNLPFILPIFLIELVLLIAALVNIFKHKKYRFGNRIMWIIIVVVFEIIGPIFYFTVGRGED